jgi:hypothetical protein
MEPVRKTLDEAANHPTVERVGDTLLVTTLLSANKTDPDYFREFGFLVWRTARALQVGAPDIPAGVTTIRFRAMRPAPTPAGAGAVTAVPLLTADVNVDELRRSKPTQVGEYGMMDFASRIQVSPLWTSAQTAFCQDPDHKEAAGFCRNATIDSGPPAWAASTNAPPAPAAQAPAPPVAAAPAMTETFSDTVDADASASDTTASSATDADADATASDTTDPGAPTFYVGHGRHRLNTKRGASGLSTAVRITKTVMHAVSSAKRHKH